MPSSTLASGAPDAARPAPLRAAFGRGLGALSRYPVIPVAILMAVLVIPALTAGWIAPHDPYQASIVDRLEPPVLAGGTWEFPLGTDRLGRCILSRTLHGAKYALGISVVGILLGTILGTALGLAAGFFRGWTDTIIMRVVDVSLALPSVLLALALAAAWGSSFEGVIFVVAFVLWSTFARQVRGEVLSLRERDFVARAPASPAPPPRASSCATSCPTSPTRSW